MITIGKLGPGDRAAWEELFRGYNTFYEVEHPQSMYDRAWEEFQRDERMHALGAWLDGSLVGIVHFFIHVRTTGTDVCYLEDLFTAPAARGHGVGRALIGAVRDWAAEHGCGRVYWHTHETNATARAALRQGRHASRVHHVHDRARRLGASKRGLVVDEQFQGIATTARSLERPRVIRGGYRPVCHSIVLPAGRSWL